LPAFYARDGVKKTIKDKASDYSVFNQFDAMSEIIFNAMFGAKELTNLNLYTCNHLHSFGW